MYYRIFVLTVCRKNNMATLHTLFLLPVFYAFIYSNYAADFEEDEDPFSYVRDPLTNDERISLDIMKIKAMAVPEPKDFFNELDDNIKEWNVEENPDLGQFYQNNNDILKKRSRHSFSHYFARPTGETDGDHGNKFTKCQTIATRYEPEQEGFEFMPSHFWNFTCVPYSNDDRSTPPKHICHVRGTGGGDDDCKTQAEDIYIFKKEFHSSCWKPKRFRIGVGCRCSVGLC